MKILIVEDERGLSRALQHILQDAGYQTAAVYSGDDGLQYAASGAFDLILLDVMLTAKSALSDRVSGLDAGADDYLTKPFEP